MQKRSAIVLIAIVAVVSVTAIALLSRNAVPLSGIAAALRGHWWAPLAYAAVYVLATMFFIPTQPLSIAAVLIWGWRIGATIELLSATLASIPPYLLARSAAGAWMQAKVQRHERIASLMDTEGFTFLLLLRVVPILPYLALNYVAGASTIRLAPYIAATFLGMIPSAYVFAYFVDAVAAGIMRPREVALRVIGAGLLFGAFVVGMRFAVRAVSKRIQS